LCLCLIGFSYLWNLDKPVLWGDEAGTAAFSRTVLQGGHPFGYDGRNLLVYENCASVSDSLVPKKIPWVQYYVGAMSLCLFGDGTGGARLLFALIGMGAFFPLSATLRERSQHPIFFTTFVLVSPQVMLFQRNARYYSILIFLFSFALWTYFHDFKSNRFRWVAVISCSVLLFHTHPLAAFCAMSALLLFCLVRDRGVASLYLVALLAGLGSWLLFYLSMKGGSSGQYLIVEALLQEPATYVRAFVGGIQAGFLDMDFVNVLPFGVLSILLLLLSAGRWREALFEAAKSPFAQIVILNLILQIVATAALLGYETVDRYSVLRYMPHMIPTSSVVLLLMVEKSLSALRKGGASRSWVTPVVVVLLFASNVLTFSFWARPLPGRSHSLSWWTSVYGEVLCPKEDPVKEVVDLILSEPGGPTGETLWVRPAMMNEVFIYYAGHRYRIVPNIRRNSDCERNVRQEIGDEDAGGFFRQPKWIIDFMHSVRRTPMGYEMRQVPYYRDAPDGSRPELTRHDFPGDRPKGNINVYKKR
jgi:hypothetical protein